ncbi:MAG: hypothetical protein ACP5JR_05090, partial [Thermoplasmata archaeon]
EEEEKEEEEVAEEEKVEEKEEEELPSEEVEKEVKEEVGLSKVSVETGTSFYIWVSMFIIGLIVYIAVISAYISGIYPHKILTSALLFLSDAIGVFGLWKALTIPSVKPTVRAEVKKAEPKVEVEEMKEEEEVVIEEEKAETEEKKEEEEKEEEKVEEEKAETEEKKEEPKEESKKVKFLCPICKTEVDADATSCPNCGVGFEE